MNKNILNKEFDCYIKKTIRNTVINYKKIEQRKMRNEVSLDNIENDDELSVPFSLSYADNLEDYFENEKIANIIANLKPVQKQIIDMIVLQNMTSQEVAEIINK